MAKVEVVLNVLGSSPQNWHLNFFSTAKNLLLLGNRWEMSHIFPNQNWKFFGSPIFSGNKNPSLEIFQLMEFPEAKCQEPSPSVSVLENG